MRRVMDSQQVMYIAKRSLETAMIISAPALGVMLVVGFLVAMLQAVTSVRDMTLGMVIKLGCLGLTIMVCGSWMMEMAVDFTQEILGSLNVVAP